MKNIFLVVLSLSVLLTNCKKEEEKEKLGTLSAAISIFLIEGDGFATSMPEKATVKLLPSNNVTIATINCDAKETVDFGKQKYGDYIIQVTGKRITQYSSGVTHTEYFNKSTDVIKLDAENKNVAIDVW